MEFLRGRREDLDGAVQAAGDQGAAAALPGHAGHPLTVRAGQILYEQRERENNSSQHNPF
jgi:hypothetical protein